VPAWRRICRAFLRALRLAETRRIFCRKLYWVSAACRKQAASTLPKLPRLYAHLLPPPLATTRRHTTARRAFPIFTRNTSRSLLACTPHMYAFARAHKPYCEHSNTHSDNTHHTTHKRGAPFTQFWMVRTHKICLPRQHLGSAALYYLPCLHRAAFAPCMVAKSTSRTVSGHRHTFTTLLFPSTCLPPLSLPRTGAFCRLRRQAARRNRRARHGVVASRRTVPTRCAGSAALHALPDGRACGPDPTSPTSLLFAVLYLLPSCSTCRSP